ncbi:lipocalin family protein [Allomuricauda sp. d1]|uniref:lipocalin family protein n=1 Tax=Allomuricauda sp. d1 TaxID=3136725 RepID=UPI0031D1D9E5
MVKALYRFFVLLFVVTACSDDSETLLDLPLESRNLVGTWQLNGYKISAGGPLPDDFTNIESATRYIFELDGSYTFIEEIGNNPLHEGTFRFIENELVLEPSEGGVDRYSFYIELSRNTMILSPTGPIICIEGCLYRYQRVD